MPKLIRLFLSTPNDVAAEKSALKSLVAELNDFFAFLAPERDVELEVLQYETHVYPDMGSPPQAIIDQQIPPDYDIHFGIMWKRCGTPTSQAQSGTIHEFDLALKRRETVGRPIIMFYFSDESISMPASSAEIDQLHGVLKFRERLASIGLTAIYPNKEAFRDRARIGLLRAIADILRTAPAQQHRITEGAGPPSGDIPLGMEKLAGNYDAIRREKASGPARTQAMTDVFSKMRSEAPKAKRALYALLTHSSPGHRLAAVAILQAFPDIDYIGWLADRLEPDLEAPFLGYQAAVALLQAARSFSPSLSAPLREEVLRAQKLASKNRNDPPRINALNYALKELEIKKAANAT